MRTTITLDDEAFEIASLYATARGITLGNAIGELIHKSQAPPTPSRIKKAPNGFPVFASRGKVITSEMVRKFQDDEIA